MMSAITTPTAFSGNIPANYDEHLGPMFFEPFARELSQHVKNLSAAKVLELAAGTGRLTRHLANELSQKSVIYATDINPAMVAHGKNLINNKRVHWMEVDAVSLPFPDENFDLVIVQFGVMFYSDKIKAFKEAKRVLRKGGQLVFTSWDHIRNNPLAQLTHQTLEKFFPLNTPAFYQVPFSYFDLDQIKKDLHDAGFTSVKIETRHLKGHAQSARDAVKGLINGTPTVTAIEQLDASVLAEFLNFLESKILSQFGSKAFEVPVQAHLVSCSLDA